jgi:hydroxyethylthiazole kinase-like uncharacterized protein yjeF
MLKILTTEQIKVLDAQTIATEPIASIDLMERASLAFVRWFVQRFNNTQQVGVVCGTGNNGGDGLAIARMLRERHYNVKVWIVKGGSEGSDFKQNRDRLAGIEVNEIQSEPDDAMFSDRHILIDALFGSGLSRPLTDLNSKVVAVINRTNCIRVSVDIPSGLMADKHSQGAIVRAHHTVTFQLPKLAFMLPENEGYTGEWHVVDIGLSAQHIEAAKSDNFYLTGTWVRPRLKPRRKFAHKGDVGRSLLIAGSHGKIGACVLAARALLRTGAGLLTVHVPECGYEILQSSVPEALVSTDKHDEFISDVGKIKDYDAIGVGPGIGTHKETVKAFNKVLKSGKPMVIDADGLNILSANKKLLRQLPPRSILTPHPGEFKRLAGAWSDDFERLELQRTLAKDTGCIVVLKGAHTCTVTPDGKAHFNSTGNPAMATGGSGDVLTGILTSLLAQGYEPGDAALIGVFVHGRAGDMALEKLGGGTIIASDIVDIIPHSFGSLL